MGITLEDVLVLAGRLDDTAGFDTPRERFRRFLVDQETSGQGCRTLIDQAPHVVDEQHHRALQDLVVLLGRSLGFDTTFGNYLPGTGGLKHDGHWRSGTRLDVVLELRTNHTSTVDIDPLARSIAAHASSAGRGPHARAIGLAVLTPSYPSRVRLEESLSAARLDVTIRVLSLRSLLFLSDCVGEGILTHDDVVRLLETVATQDFVIGLFEKLAHSDEPELVEVRTAQRRAEAAPVFWLATVDGDSAITAERFVEVVIGKRRIFGVRGDGHPSGTVHQGDRILFLRAGTRRRRKSGRGFSRTEGHGPPGRASIQAARSARQRGAPRRCSARSRLGNDAADPRRAGRRESEVAPAAANLGADLRVVDHPGESRGAKRSLDHRRFHRTSKNGPEDAQRWRFAVTRVIASDFTITF